jgi:hypothetical protein
VLSRIVREVYSIEIVPELARSAAERLIELGYRNVIVRQGDGYQGWADKAPFDRIILTAAPKEVPTPLLDQLIPGGRLVAPVGASLPQSLIVLTRRTLARCECARWGRSHLYRWCLDSVDRESCGDWLRREEGKKPGVAGLKAGSGNPDQTFADLLFVARAHRQAGAPAVIHRKREKAGYADPACGRLIATAVPARRSFRSDGGCSSAR